MKSRHSATLFRPPWICWTDAAGASRLIAAVVYGPHGLFCVRAKVTAWLWCQFLPRGDNPIGVHEALAVWLLVMSVKKLLGGALLNLYVDKERGYGDIYQGFLCFAGDNPHGGYLLVSVSKEHLLPMFYKIESKDQTADGPTRPTAVGCS